MGRLLKAMERFADMLRSSHADPHLGPPTLSVGRIEGGTSVNTVPDRCQIAVDRRLIPGEDPKEALRQFAAYMKNEASIDFPFECSEPWLAMLPLHWQGPEGRPQLVDRLGKAIGQVRCSLPVMAVSHRTCASRLAGARVPAFGFC